MKAYLSVSYQKSVDRRQLDGTSFSPVVVVRLREQQLAFHCKPKTHEHKVLNQLARLKSQFSLCRNSVSAKSIWRVLSIATKF